MDRQSAERRFYRLMLTDRLLWRGYPSRSPRFETKRELVRALHAASPWRGPRAPEPLPELPADAGRAALLEATAGLTRPAVIRGFYRDSPAVTDWDRARLTERLAGQPCSVLSWEGALRERGWDVGARVLTMDFAEYLARMDDEPLYLNNSTEIATACPELVEAMDLPRLREALLEPGTGWDELVFLNFFMGGRRVFSELHAAPAGNFFFALIGRKRWVFLAPSMTPYVHGVTRPPFQVFRSALGGFRAQAKRDEAGEADRDRAPLTALPRYEVVLEPGDLLYNAPWWWHEVENLDDFTLGCAARHLPTPFRAAPTWPNHRAMTLASIYPLGRAITFAHYLLQRATGRRGSIRALTEPLNTGVLRRLLRGGRLD